MHTKSKGLLRRTEVLRERRREVMLNWSVLTGRAGGQQTRVGVRLTGQEI